MESDMKRKKTYFQVTKKEERSSRLLKDGKETMKFEDVANERDGIIHGAGPEDRGSKGRESARL